MKINKLILLILITFCSYNLLASNISEYRKLYNFSKSELKIIIKLQNKSKKKSPKLEFRKLEILMQMTEAMRSMEHQNFLYLSEKQATNIDKKKVYKNSRKIFFNLENKFKKFIINHPNYSGSGLLYYSITTFYIDYNINQKIIPYFLKKAILLSNGNKENIIHSRTLLANYYFNIKKFIAAASLYKKLIRKKTDKNYFQNLYNLAWCMFKMEKIHKTIYYMEKILKSPRQTGLKEMVLNNIHQFFIYEKKFNKGIRFISKYSGKDISYLIKFAESTFSKGYTAASHKAYMEALKKVPINSEKSFTIRYSMLEITKIKNHPKRVSRQIKKMYFIQKKILINKENKAKFKNKLLANTNSLQKLILNDSKYKNALMIHLSILSKINKKDQFRYKKVKADALFETKDYENALRSYVLLVDVGLKRKKFSYVKDVLNKILLILNQKEFKLSSKNKYYFYVYKKFIKYFPKSNEKEMSYQKIYNIYFKKRKIKRSYHVLMKYRQNYPKKITFFKSGIVQILAYYKKMNKKAQYRLLLKKLDKFGFNRKEILMAKSEFYSSLLKEGLELAKSNKPKLAIAKYKKLFVSKLTPSFVKIESSQNALTIATKLKDWKEVHYWVLNWFSLLIPKSKNDSLKTINSLLMQMYLNKNEAEMKRTGVSILDAICSSDYQEKNYYFANLINLLNLSNDFNSAFKILKRWKQCNISINSFKKLANSFVDLYGGNGQYNALIKMNKYFLTFNFLRNKILLSSFNTAKAYRTRENFRKYNKIMKLIQTYIKRYKLTGPLVNQLSYSQKINQYIKSVNKLKSPQLRYPENVFQQIIDKRLGLLSKYSGDLQSLSKNGIGEDFYKVNKFLVDQYKKFIVELENFTPENKDTEYIKLFRANIHQLILSVKDINNNLILIGRKYIVKNQLLTRYNNYYMSKVEVSGIELNFQLNSKAQTIDRSKY